MIPSPVIKTRYVDRRLIIDVNVRLASFWVVDFVVEREPLQGARARHVMEGHFAVAADCGELSITSCSK